MDESTRSSEPPGDYVRRVAESKAEASGEAGGLVLAADTIVVLDEAILGKPRDLQDARDMLRRLSGRRHEVLTAVVLREPATARRGVEVAATQVELAPLAEAEIDWYLATGEPMDKAGSYAIQGLGAFFVESVIGNYSNVVGLPVPALYRLFRGLGYDLKSFRGT